MSQKYPDKYVGIRIPEDLASEIDEIIKARKLGYKTRAEFVKEAVRRLLKESQLYLDR